MSKKRLVKEGWLAVHPLHGPDDPRVEVVPAVYCEQVEADLRKAKAKIKHLNAMLDAPLHRPAKDIVASAMEQLRPGFMRDELAERKSKK